MRCWLVDRDFDDKGMVRLVYATPDGTKQVIRERSAARLGQYDVTAAIDVDEAQLEPVGADLREQYAGEVARMKERHEPDDTV